MMRKSVTFILVAPALLLGGCEIGTKLVEQTGPRGAAMKQVADKSSVVKAAARAGAVPAPPYPLTPEMLEGPRARETYQNVQVLGDISTEEFNYTMAALTNWVSPADGTVKNGGCNYCHNPANMASDELYTKVVARKMLQMTRNLNANWTPHFANSNYAGKGAGVTCWTCHRGKPVPLYNWSTALPNPGTIRGNKFGQNTPAQTVAFSSLPYDPFTALLQGQNPPGSQSQNPAKNPIRVQAPSAYPTTYVESIQNTERTYGLMMHMSQGLGVNCTYCHNTQNFANWSQSRVQRVNAWYGIRMVRDTNDNYITALGNVWPANRRGPAGDPRKVNCTTCHQGLNKPLGGYPMLRDYPGLHGVGNSAVATLNLVAPAGITPIAADPRATPAMCNAEFRNILSGAEVRFATDSAALDTSDTSLLDRLASLAGRCSAERVTIEGHTDVTGSQAANLPLSRDRAAAVANYLIAKGVRPAQLAAIGYGESKPKAVGTADQANMVNRRIEIFVGAPIVIVPKIVTVTTTTDRNTL